MNPGNEVATLRAEVASLRRRVGVLFGMALAALAAALVATWGPRQPTNAWRTDVPREMQFEAQEYHLLDPNGNLRGIWRCPPAGPSLTLLDEEGRTAVELWQSPGRGGAIRVNDATGRMLFERP